MRRAAAIGLALCLPTSLASARSDEGLTAATRSEPGATAARSDPREPTAARSDPGGTAATRSAPAEPSRVTAAGALTDAAATSAAPQAAPAERPGAANAEHDAAPAEAPQLWGSWEWAGDAAERAGIEAAITFSTDGLFFIVKAIAKGRLRERSAIPQRYTLTLADGSIAAESTGNLPMRSPAEGGEVAYRSVLGEAVRLSQRVAGGALVQVLAADGGVRTNTFSLSRDGATLTLHVVVASGSLARPLDYQLTYRRVR